TTAEIDLIQKPATASGTASVVFVIGDPQSANTLSELHSTNPKHLGGYEVINEYAIFLPTAFASGTNDLSNPADTSLYLTLGHSKTDSNEFADLLSVQFSGGANEGEDDAYIIEGNASTTSKAYNY
ncbi:MAG TPA: hypothetical protein VHY22_03110, partial [Chthoniobacteraceae bacterium]|nr:hypothetical protein [Chthoniobacteraceae bacterium]